MNGTKPAQHTPGIAQADEQSRCGEAMTALSPSLAPWHRVVTNEGECLAITADNGDRVCTLKQGLLTTNANGRLIAVAPESHEANKAALDILLRIGPPAIQQGTLCEEQDYDTTIRLLRAVISEVEGK